MEALLISLLIFMIISAVVALRTDELLSAVIAVGAVGFGSSAVFLLLRAPDLAITQIVLEVAALVLLIRATISIGVRTTSAGRRGWRPVAIAAAAFMFLVFTSFSFRDMPEFGVPVMDRVVDAPSIFYLENGLRSTGAPNHVMAVLLDFRAYDTLGEATIIFTAVFGTLTLLRKSGKKSRYPNENASESQTKKAELLEDSGDDE